MRFLALILTVGMNLQAAMVYFTNPVQEISKFFDMTSKGTRVLSGVSETGEACRIGITKTDVALVISPLSIEEAPPVGVVPSDLRDAMAFVVIHSSQYEMRGGIEGTSLSASYFLDDVKPITIHGQYGFGFRVEADVDAQGKLTNVSFRKTRALDISHEYLAETTCSNLKAD